MTTPTPSPDLLLARRAAAGHTDAWERIVELYGERIYNVALHFAPTPEDAEDLTQDVFLKLYRNLRRYRGDVPFVAWTLRLSRNLCIDRWRSRRTERAHTVVSDEILKWLPADDDPEADAQRRRRLEAIHAALDEMDQEHGESVLLKPGLELGRGGGVSRRARGNGQIPSPPGSPGARRTGRGTPSSAGLGPDPGAGGHVMTDRRKTERALEALLREVASVRAPLPDRLAERLRAIPESHREPSAPPAQDRWPRVPMPPALHRRLAEIPERPVLPRWLTDTRWAVAASLVLAVLAGIATGGPERLGRHIADSATAAERLARDTGETVRIRSRKDFATARERLSEIRLPSTSWNLFTDPEDRDPGDPR